MQSHRLTPLAFLLTTLFYFGPAVQADTLPVLTQGAEPELGEALRDTPVQDYHFSNQSAGSGQTVPATNTGGWSIQATNRQLVRAFYNNVYTASLNTPINWTGTHSPCSAGTTSSDFKNAVVARINYFRAMAGVPATITLDATFNAKAQQAALMMSANNTLDHFPPSSWNCYTADGYQAAGSSNISLGHNGWNAVAGQMRDNGSGNTVVGHRRWLLLPQTQQMGTGDVASSGTYLEANAIWVRDGRTYNTRPTTRDTFVAWPTQGFNPYQEVPVRWSFSYPQADFSAATVSMSQAGSAIPVSLETVATGYAENTLVWRPNNMDANPSSARWPKPTADTTYQVTISNVLINGTARNFSYAVTIFDPEYPNTAEEKAVITGLNNPTAGSVANYAFNSISIATGYDVRRTELGASSEIYTAETNSPAVNDGTDSSYTLLYSGSGTNGTTVYRLAPSLTTQTVEPTLNFVPSNNSELKFDSKLGYATTQQTAALQVSTDGGASWVDVYTKTGTGQSGVEESTFTSKTISLAAYANQFIKIRAQYRYAGTGSYYTGTGSNVSFLVDNIQVTHSKKVLTDTIQDLGANTQFSFTPTLNKEYALAIRGKIWTGYQGLEWGPVFYVTPQAAADFDNDGIPDAQDPDDDNDGMPDTWEGSHNLNPRDASDASTDLDGDGLTNLQEYQHNTDPHRADSDGDGMNDKDEVDAGRNPTDPSDAQNSNNATRIIPIMLDLLMKSNP